jgi:hypothetical protein
MDKVLKELEQFGDLAGTFTLLDVAVVFGLSLLLSLIVGWVYRATHRGVSYSQSYVQTLVMLGVMVAFIMLIVGSNIARAFSLVGALSIIRFRSAIKETRDLGFVFMAMGIGMACGTRFYALAVFATIALSGAVIAMHKLNLFAKQIRERILLVHMPHEANLEEMLVDLFRTHLEEYHLISVETVREGVLQEAIYSIVMKKRLDPSKLIEAIRARNGNNKVSLVLGQQEIDL